MILEVNLRGTRAQSMSTPQVKLYTQAEFLAQIRTKVERAIFKF
jgi:hypothetical protein